MIPADEWYTRGIRGVSFKDVKRWINRNKLELELLNDNNLLEFKRYIQTSKSRGKHCTIFPAVRLLISVFNLFSISMHNVFPYLNLIFHRKEEEVKGE